MNIYVINKSQRITDDEAQKMVDACQIQMAGQVALLWDRFPPKVQLVKDGEQKKGQVHTLWDSPDQEGCLGYHLEDDEGNVVGETFASPVLDNGGTVLKDGDKISVASVLAHEIIEAFLDPDINQWVSFGDEEVALEAGDPVQGDSYDIALPDGTLVSVSNFVTPNWFDPEASSDFDYCNKVSRPFTLSAGGYMVVRSAPGSERQVFGETEPPTWRQALGARRKQRCASR